MQIYVNSHGKYEYSKSEQVFKIVLFCWNFFLSLKMLSKCVKDSEKQQQKNPNQATNQILII